MSLTQSVLQEFQSSVKGEIQLPGTDAFENNVKTNRTWNKCGLRKPAAIVQVQNVHDVSNAVKIAAKAGLTIAVACGRHSNIWAGRHDGAVVIDMSPMSACTVDPEKRVAVVEGGAQLKHLDEECRKFKLHTTAGHDQSTGLGGLVLGGGFGYLARTFGMAIDNLLSVEIVVANGDIVEASETTNPDLFWAVRGGGSNFGIVTQFSFKLYPVDRAWFCNAVFSWDHGEQIMEYVKEKDWAANLAEEASAAFILGRHPESKQQIIMGLFVVIGDTDEKAQECGHQQFNEIFAKFPPLHKVEEAKDYLFVQRHLGEQAAAGSFMERGCVTTNECAELMTTVKQFLEGWKYDGMSGILLGGGAIRRKKITDCAWYPRAFNWWLVSLAKIPEDIDEASLEEAKEYMNAYGNKLEPYRFTDYTSVVDGSAAPARSSEAYYGPNAERLRSVKAQWDPQNVFCHNRNIQPRECEEVRSL